MKNRPILKITLLLTILVEIVLVVTLFNRIGFERLPFQLLRILFQLILISIILYRRSEIALFVLVGYHVIIGLQGLFGSSSSILLVQVLAVYHLVIGVVIYFHDWLEDKLFARNH